MRNRLRLSRNFDSADRDVFGIAPIPSNVGTRKHGVADGQAGNLGTQRLDNSGEIPAERQGKDVGNHGLQVPLPDLPIDRVDRRGDNAHERLVGCDRRLGRVFELEDRAVSVGMDPDGFHEISLDLAAFVFGGNPLLWERSLASVALLPARMRVAR